MNDANIFAIFNERQFARNLTLALFVIFFSRLQSFEAMRAELAEISSIESNVQHLSSFFLLLRLDKISRHFLYTFSLLDDDVRANDDDRIFRASVRDAGEKTVVVSRL